MTNRSTMIEQAWSPPISMGQPGVAVGSPGPAEDRFTCLPGCGLCCSYRVLVTEVDRQRLQAPGDNRQPWETTTSGELALHRTQGFCLFLDSRQRCTVYEHRPEQCRAYPFLWTAYERLELDVDLSCPGLGYGDAIPEAWRQPPARCPQQQGEHEQAIGQVRDLLRAQRRYASAEMLAVLGGRCLEGLLATWKASARENSSTLDLEQDRPLLANVETKDGLDTIWQGLHLVPQSTRGLLGRAGWLERHFAHPRWNTRLSPGGDVQAYRFWLARGVLHVEMRDGLREHMPLADLEWLPWQPEALVARRAYLQRWLERQLAVRLANNLTLASLQPGRHAATSFLQLLFEIDHRLAILAPALAQAGNRESIDRKVALEAIRGSDGLLRAWCESARVGLTQ